MTPGGILEVATARHVANIRAEGAITEPDTFKFLCEAAIATAVQPGLPAEAINREIGEMLFGTSHRLRLLKNPRLCSLYALPLVFLRDPPPGAAEIAELFLALHRAGAVQAVSYPEYRNVEMDYVAARLAGRAFAPPSLARFALAFGWMTRDHCYGLTHLMLYASDFGRTAHPYADDEVAMVEALIAAADRRGDVDLLLELILCHATMANAAPARRGFYAELARRTVEELLDRLSADAGQERFATLYHPLFVAWIHSALGIEPLVDEHEAARHDLLANVMQGFAQGDPLAALAAAHDLFAIFGANPAIERLIDLQGALLVRAMDDRAETTLAAAAA